MPNSLDKNKIIIREIALKKTLAYRWLFPKSAEPPLCLEQLQSNFMRHSQHFGKCNKKD